MPVSIYALAKDLGIDNAQLLDICQSVGISGKGSALASLDDDETARIKEFMSGGGQVATVEEKPDNAPIRPERNEDLKAPVRELPTRPKESSPPPVSKPGPLSNFGKKKAEPVEEAPEVASDETAHEPVAPVEPVAKSEPDTPPVRPLMERPRQENRQMRDMDRKRKPGERSNGPKSPRQKPRANFRVAAMPEVKQPTGKSTSPKEKVQKPDISLGKKELLPLPEAKKGAKLRWTSSTNKTKAKAKKANRDAVVVALPLSQIRAKFLAKCRAAVQVAEKTKIAKEPLAMSIQVWAAPVRIEPNDAVHNVAMTIDIPTIAIGLDSEKVLQRTLLHLEKKRSSCKCLAPFVASPKLRVSRQLRCC